MEDGKQSKVGLEKKRAASTAPAVKRRAAKKSKIPVPKTPVDCSGYRVSPRTRADSCGSSVPLTITKTSDTVIIERDPSPPRTRIGTSGSNVVTPIANDNSFVSDDALDLHVNNTTEKDITGANILAVDASVVNPVSAKNISSASVDTSAGESGGVTTCNFLDDVICVAVAKKDTDKSVTTENSYNKVTNLELDNVADTIPLTCTGETDDSVLDASIVDLQPGLPSDIVTNVAPPIHSTTKRLSSRPNKKPATKAFTAKRPSSEVATSDKPTTKAVTSTKESENVSPLPNNANRDASRAAAKNNNSVKNSTNDNDSNTGTSVDNAGDEGVLMQFEMSSEKTINNSNDLGVERTDASNLESEQLDAMDGPGIGAAMNANADAMQGSNITILNPPVLGTESEHTDKNTLENRERKNKKKKNNIITVVGDEDDNGVDLGTPVAFDESTKIYQLVLQGKKESDIKSYCIVVNGKKVLFGVVFAANVIEKNIYAVKWRHDELPMVHMRMKQLCTGLQLYSRYSMLVKAQESAYDKLQASLAPKMFELDRDDMRMDPFDSGTEDEDGHRGDDDEPSQLLLSEGGSKFKTNVDPFGQNPIMDHVVGRHDVGRDEDPDGMLDYSDEVKAEVAALSWDIMPDDQNVNVANPMDPSTPQGAPSMVNRKTKVRDCFRSLFETPLTSLLAMVPRSTFEWILIETNRYGETIAQKSNPCGHVSGRLWRRLSIDELMTFFGISIMMAVMPTPGQEMSARWDNLPAHPYCAKMDFRRFCQVRAALHFSRNEDMEASNDALFKVRPLLNVVKRSCGSYLSVGTNLSVDESSISCPSKYDNNFIFFCPSKPSGKYHCRFYSACCAETFATLRFVVATDDKSDLADPFLAEEEIATINHSEYEAPTLPGANIENVATAELMRPPNRRSGNLGFSTNIVLNLVRPYFGKGHVVNIDQFYNSPQLAIALKKHNTYSRGTCMPNREGFPKELKIPEAAVGKVERGTVAVARARGDCNYLCAFSWVDSKQVMMLSTADGTQMSNVYRIVSHKKTKFNAPLAVCHYNQYAQGVDRNDQLRELYSLAKAHPYKKFYKKLAMAILDVAIVNAEIHFFLVHPEKKKVKNHRYMFWTRLAHDFMNVNWSSFIEPGANAAVVGSSFDVKINNVEVIDPHVGEEYNDAFLFQKGKPPMLVPASPVEYTKVAIEKGHDRQKIRRSCQVCRYERRSIVTKSVCGCMVHGILACTKVPTTPPLTDMTKYGVLDLEAKSVEDRVKPWICPEIDEATGKKLTCWEKMHRYYIPNKAWVVTKKQQGIMYNTVSINKKCDLYQVREAEIHTVEANRLIRKLRCKTYDENRERKKQKASMNAIGENNNDTDERHESNHNNGLNVEV